MNMRIKELLVLFFFMWNISLSSKGQQRVHSIGLETEGTRIGRGDHQRLCGIIHSGG